ncbi:hypothetical protein [Pseudogulbenkiania ferrooxidans]|uniref:hypothetical protein n=1 Tax=Pseudogulbenkiania ferrooxidans TaxID=549169 RepID=UPI0013766CBB|nr:hypothetical protein [Pseudogulbenkiania ferrooxidans]
MWVEDNYLFCSKFLKVDKISLHEIVHVKYYYQGDTPVGVRVKLRDGQYINARFLSIFTSKDEIESFHTLVQVFFEELNAPLIK